MNSHWVTKAACCCGHPVPNRCCGSWSKVRTGRPFAPAPAPLPIRSGRSQARPDGNPINTSLLTNARSTMSRTPLIAGNWKMHGSRTAVDEFVAGLAADAVTSQVDMLVCAPFVYLQQLATAFAGTPVAVGAENLSAEVDAGAF